MKELCLDFVNTRWYLTHKLQKEILTDDHLAKKFFSAWQLDISSPLAAGIAERLLVLRSFIAETLEDLVSKQTVSAAAIDEINRYLALSYSIREMEETTGQSRIMIKPLIRDWNWVMTEVAASFAELVSEADRTRIKICENPDCGWFFYDETKSRTKRWCDDTCASLMKVRKFRAKRKNG